MYRQIRIAILSSLSLQVYYPHFEKMAGGHRDL